MDKLVKTSTLGGKQPRQLAIATVLTVAASLLVAGTTSPAMADPDPTPASTVPTITQFPKPKDPDAVFRAAIEEARKQGRPVEVTEAFTETARHWAYPDGHLTTQSYAGPTQLRRADGSWAFIDTTLVEQGGVLKPKLAKADLEFSAGGQDRPLASMERGNGQRFSLTWPRALPKPTINGNVATYADAAGYPGADLVVTALPTGFRHDVVLRTRPTGPVEFRIPVDTDGLAFAEAKKGGLQLTDAKGKQVASAAEPVAVDAGPNPAEAANRQAIAPRTGKIDTRIAEDKGRQTLVLKPDPAFLNDPATRYPVTVDPTTTLALQSDLIVSNQATYDTSPASPQLMTSIERTVSNGSLTYSHSLLKFDTGPLTGRSVGSARLDVYAEQLVGCRWYGPGGIEAKRVTSGWPATGVSWSSQPSVTSFGSSIQFCPSTSGIDANGNWIPHTFTWDVTAMAQAWASGYPDQGIRLSGKGDSDPPQGSGWWVYFHSADRTGGTPPKLTVSYFLPPEIPTVTAESIDSLTGNDAIARSQSVKVGFKSSVPEGTNLNYTVTVNDSTMLPPPAFPTGHVAHWKFDEPSSAAAAADSGPNGYTATYTGTRRTATTGKLGGALQLNDMTGSGGCCLPDAYAVTSRPVLNQNSSFTLSTWVRLTDSEAIQTVASQDGNPFGLDIYYLGSSYQKWRLQISGTGGSNGYGVWVDSAKVTKADTWTHLVAMYDAAAAKIRLYLDGALSGEADYTPTGSVTAGPFRIGNYKSGSFHLQGAVDDMRVYQRALTTKEIKDLYGEVAATSYNAKPSGQVIQQTFSLDNPASLKFVVKACRSGITQPSCNESPAYRITSDAPMLPADTKTGMADPVQPVLSGMVNRPSGGPMTARYYLYDSSGAPVGAAPLGERAVNGGERASFQIPINTVQPGTAYRWQMQACAQGQTIADEVCTSKTSSVSFTIPGTPPPDPVEDVRHLALGRSSFVIKTAKTDPTACSGGPCAVADAATMQIGGMGVEKATTLIGFSLDELPDGAGVSEAVLKLGTPICPAGPCPADATITATPLKSPVTSETKGSDLVADADSNTSAYSLPLNTPQADIAGSEYQWLMLTSNKDEVVTFADASAAEQPSLALTYLPAGPPSKVLNLTVSGGDASALASWGLPDSNGSVAMLDGYDIEVTDNSGAIVKTLEAKEPYAAISGLVNDVTYTVKVRAKTAFGVSGWEAATATTKAVPPPPIKGGTTCLLELPTAPHTVTAATDAGGQAYIDRIKAYYQAQDAVLENRATTIWDAPGVAPDAPSTAKLSLANAALIQKRASMTRAGITRTNSQVQVSDTVIQAMSDGTVRVAADINRTWNEEASAMAGAAVRTGGNATSQTPGQVEPSESTISIFIFDRCGNITVIQVTSDVEEDSTDSFETDGESFIAQKLRSPDDDVVAASSSATAMVGESCRSNVKSWSGAHSKEETRPAKGLLFEVVGQSKWDACFPYDDTTWNISKFGAVATLYTDSSFRKPKGASAKKVNAYVLNNSGVDINSTACFKVTTTTYQLGVQGNVGLPKGGEVGGGLTFTQTASKDCPGQYSLIGDKGGSNDKIAFRSSFWGPKDALIATCWMSTGNTCSISRYQQRTFGTFNWAKQKGIKTAKIVAASSSWMER
ncbi:LamG-like jellyroll fold domain-containing protein [Sphaerisporangium dianthi]|uniref:LamG-like jellyroll fold domain-containing protein n=1 Tax=Sphaerisporangium dianthi TaxID=1436120 RepID=A0ABV9CSD8_9ACTN